MTKEHLLQVVWPEIKRSFARWGMFLLGFLVATLMHKYAFWFYIKWLQWRYGVCP